MARYVVVARSIVVTARSPVPGIELTILSHVQKRKLTVMYSVPGVPSSTRSAIEETASRKHSCLSPHRRPRLWGTRAASRAPRGPCQLRPPIVRRIWVGERPLSAECGTRRVYAGCHARRAGASARPRVYVRGQGEQTKFMSAGGLVGRAFCLGGRELPSVWQLGMLECGSRARGGVEACCNGDGGGLGRTVLVVPPEKCTWSASSRGTGGSEQEKLCGTWLKSHRNGTRAWKPT